MWLCCKWSGRGSGLKASTSRAGRSPATRPWRWSARDRSPLFPPTTCSPRRLLSPTCSMLPPDCRRPGTPRLPSNFATEPNSSPSRLTAWPSQPRVGFACMAWKAAGGRRRHPPADRRIPSPEEPTGPRQDKTPDNGFNRFLGSSDHSATLEWLFCFIHFPRNP